MIEDYIHLLHRQSFGVLATHSETAPGFPFASVLPFAPDTGQKPLFFISRLAEHTRNLESNGKASFLLFDPANQDVLLNPRVTVLGTVEAVPRGEALQSRYLRYQPDAAQYMAFADFQFYRLTPERIRTVAGFGRMGWENADAMSSTETWTEEEEEIALEQVQKHSPANVTVLGLDPWGVDFIRAGVRHRQEFTPHPVTTLKLMETAQSCLLR